MAKIDFITLANIIFKNKDKYKYVSDEEKEINFFVLNRKFALKYLKQAQFFNNKNIDKPSAIDIWYQVFYKTSNGIPQWWWKTKQTQASKVSSDFNINDLKLIKKHYNLKDRDIEFLIKYYNEKLKKDIIRLKKFNKE